MKYLKNSWKVLSLARLASGCMEILRILRERPVEILVVLAVIGFVCMFISLAGKISLGWGGT